MQTPYYISGKYRAGVFEDEVVHHSNVLSMYRSRQRPAWGDLFLNLY